MDALERIYLAIQTKLHLFAYSKQWKLKTVVLCLFLSLFLSTPKYLYFYNYLSGNVVADKYEALKKQIDHPFLPVYYGPASHESKMAFRLTIPVFAHVMHLNILGIYIIQFILGVISIYLFLLLILSITQNRELSVLLTIAFATSYSGTSAFIDVWGFLDSYVFFFFLLIAYFNNPLLTGIVLLFSYFTDERAVFGSLLFPIWFYLFKRENNPFSPVRNIAAMGVALLTYGILRILLIQYFGLHMGTGTIGPVAFLQNFNNIGLGILEGMKGFWIFIFLAAIILYMNKQKWVALLYASACMLIFTVSLMVWDNTRSFSYMILSIPLSIMAFHTYIKPNTVYKFALLVTILNILTPLYSVQLELYWINPFFFDIIKKLFQLVV